MSEDGYTLIETLVALAMLSFAIAGLSAGVQVLNKWQRATNDVVGGVKDMRRAQVSLERMVEGWGPFRSDHPEALSGDATGFRFACGQPAPCAVGVDQRGGKLVLTLDDAHGGIQALPLDRRGPARFSYRGSENVSDTWPPVAPGLQIVRTIALDQPGAAGPMLVARLWREQPADCAFDSVMQDCR